MNSSSLHSQVLIIGAGPAGLSMGISLAQQGIQSTIVEKRLSATKTSNAVLLKPSSLSLLEQLNVIDEILEKGHILNGIEYFCNRKYVASIEFQKSLLPYPFCVSLPQNETEQILIQRFMQLGGKILWGHTLTKINNAKGNVEGTLHSSQDNSENFFCCNYLIAADGSNSKARDLLNLNLKERSHPKQSFLIADVIMRWKMPNHTIHTFFTKQGSLSIIKLPKDYARIIANITSQCAIQNKPHFEIFQSLIKEATPFTAILGQPEWSTKVSVSPNLQKAFSYGNIFFIGDAAHTFPILCGQGYNLGIQDALNLSWKIALSLKGHASKQLLQTYQKERKPIAKCLYKKILFASKLLTYRYAISGVFKTALLRLMRLFWYTEEKLHVELGEMVFSYRKSPIIHRGGELAFAYLPILNNKKHLLIVNRLSSKERYVLQEKILNRYEHLLDYCIDEFPGEPAQVLIIRPDQFIGFRGKRLNFRKLSRYLKKTFSC